jgi:ribonuclease HI
MKIDNKFLELASKDDELNQTQLEILGFKKDEMLEKVISDANAALVVLLRGLDEEAQKLVVENYQRVKELKKLRVDQNKKEINIESSDAITIYCDGACVPNPGEAGSGVILYIDNNPPILYYGDYEPNGTNNIAELNALFKALQLASESLKNSSNVTINSDSKYSIDCITKWAYGWKSKGWSKKGGEIKNLELIKKAHNLYDQIKDKIKINYVKGHSGVEGNELADRMGMIAIREQNIDYKTYDYEDIDEVLALT